MNKIVAWLREESATGSRREPAAPGEEQTLEGRLRREVREARAQVLREAVRCLRVLNRPPPTDLAPLADLLRDPCDELVVEVLAAFGAWRAEAVLPDLLALHRRVSEAPAEREVIAVALDECLHAITRRTFASADELAAWLARTRHAA